MAVLSIYPGPATVLVDNWRRFETDDDVRRSTLAPALARDGCASGSTWIPLGRMSQDFDHFLKSEANPEWLEDNIPCLDGELEKERFREPTSSQ
jgi:hypothetical protein